MAVKKPIPAEVVVVYEEPAPLFTLGLAKHKDGYAVVGLLTQGRRVLKEKVFSEVMPMGFAAQALKTFVFTHIVRPGTKLFFDEDEE